MNGNAKPLALDELVKLLVVLAADEAAQKKYLLEWGHETLRKDDLAEELERIMSTINADENLKSQISDNNSKFIGEIFEIFQAHSGEIETDFWYFASTGLQEDWQKVSEYARLFLENLKFRGEYT